MSARKDFRRIFLESISSTVEVFPKDEFPDMSDYKNCQNVHAKKLVSGGYGWEANQFYVSSCKRQCYGFRFSSEQSKIAEGFVGSF